MNRPDGDEGAIALLAAALAVALFGFGAIVVDLGMARVTSADSHEAVDAAALAGATALYEDPSAAADFDAAAEAVFSSAEGNGTARTSWDTCTAEAPGPNWVKYDPGGCIAFDSPTTPRRIRVVLPARHVDAAFGGIFGYSGGDVFAAAVAQARDRSMQDCSLCVSGRLDVDGTVQADGDGSIIAGSGHVGAAGIIRLTPAAVGNDAGIAFESWPPDPEPPSGRYSPQPGQEMTQDPFTDVSALPFVPPLIDSVDFTCNDGDTLLSDVTYRALTVQGSCSMPPDGTVFVTGKMLIKTGATLSGSLSTLYFTCREHSGQSPGTPCGINGSHRGRLDVQQGGDLTLVGGSVSSVAASRSISVLYDPDNVNGYMRVNGSVSTGSIYQRVGSAVTVGSAGSLEVNGLVSVSGLTVDAGGEVGVTASDLGSRTGPFRVALAK